MSAPSLRLESPAPVRIPQGSFHLDADLFRPAGAQGIVIFAHGSGSGRQSPRNRYVASILHQRRLATLLMDLLTPGEDEADRETGHFRFDVAMLASRLGAAASWLASQASVSELPLGYFGASTGAGAALIAAAEEGSRAAAVVSRGGRPDLACASLGRVTAPTLLLVGSLDLHVLDLNRQALARLHAPKHLEIVPGASHLFEEPGTLEAAAKSAAAWFERHLGRGSAQDSAVRPRRCFDRG